MAECVKAEVKQIEGRPVLHVNGEAVYCPMLFVNTDCFDDLSIKISQSQVKKAADAGIHYVSIIVHTPFHTDEPNDERYADIAAKISMVLDADPKSKVFIRIKVEDSLIEFVNPDDVMQYNDGSVSWRSIADDKWLEEAKLELARIVGYIRKHSRFAPSVFGWHLECDEWFQHEYREKGIDISPANSRAFRAWLRKKYADDREVSSAWGQNVTLNDAVAPRDMPNSPGMGEPPLLFSDKTDKRFIDYLDYINERVAYVIDELAHTIKNASNRENLVIAFYGYYYDLFDARSGHFCLRRLLASDAIDGFASPVSYSERNGESQSITAASAYMSPVDAIIASGKLWINESDQRTFINLTNKPNDIFCAPIKNLTDVYEVHKREVGGMMVHGNAMYAMDLCAMGWLDDVTIWQNLANLGRVNEAWSKSGIKPEFDVAVVIDERAASVISDAIKIGFQNFQHNRTNFYRSGISFALETMNDGFFERAEKYKMFFFLNPFRLDDKSAEKIKKITTDVNKTGVFLYSFGSFAEKASDILLRGPNVFDESLVLSPEQIRNYCRIGGVHVYSDEDDNFISGRGLIVFNARTAGDKHIHLPEAADVYDYFTGIWLLRTETKTVKIENVREGECRYLFFGDRRDIEKIGLPTYAPYL